MIPELSSLVGKVLTVTGPIDAADMGITLPHEHLLTLHTPPEVVLSDPDLAAEELGLFFEAGGRTVVEVTSRGIRRDPAGLRAISEASGVQIVMGSGHYKWRWHPEDMDRRTTADITREIIEDITVGADGTGIRSGVIGEVGVSETLQYNEEKSLVASAHAQLETGVALNLHVHLIDKVEEERLRTEVLDILQREGVDLSRVIVSHCEASPDAVDYHERIIERDAYVEYDLFGMGARESSALPTYEQEIAGIRDLIGRGYLDRILISQDICYNDLLVANGGWGYAHILNDVVPRFREFGVDDVAIRTMMVGNPARLFPITSPA
ncbi:MAG: phosphotriesterase-related protein [Candidatus Latescibacteria bacterium]|jgi:phosphotriesterase-related protein|nr:phosphotriesterase-related protein [Candidatus Latescibacterota bacterium]